ncbi:MAG: ABC transporter ATP-binding protein [Desulfurivibrionaceae bacterium]
MKRYIERFLYNIFGQRIVELVRPYSKRVILAAFFSMAVSASNGAIAWLVKPVVDSLFVENNHDMLVWFPLVVVLVYGIQGVCQMTYTYLMASTGFQMVRDLRGRLYSHFLKISLPSISRETSGKFISRIITDTGQLRKLLSVVLLSFFKDVPTIIVLFGVAIYRRWDVTLLAMLVLPGIIHYARYQGKKVKKKRGRAQQNIAMLSHIINETSNGAKVVKSFVNEKWLADRFYEQNNANFKQERRIIIHKELTRLIANFSSGIGVALVIWYGGSLVINDVITSGDLFSALGAVAMTFGPLKQLAKAYTEFREVEGAAQRLWWLEEMEVEESGKTPVKELRKEISYKGVSHRYSPDGELVLQDINLTIHKGEVLAIVGPSGAGKTTLVDLLLRFYDPYKGEVQIDGLNLVDADLSDLRRLFGLVSQDVVLFHDTVKDNISFGTPTSFDDIKKAAKLAYADSFIEELPDGYETFLGERGANLSGGQRQRLAIARAILKNSPILILDEATSSLDSVSEKLVQEALERLMKDKTTIVIAHRLSTIRHADRILVLQDGKIADQGSHEELLASSTTYNELYYSFN